MFLPSFLFTLSLFCLLSWKALPVLGVGTFLCPALKTTGSFFSASRYLGFPFAVRSGPIASFSPLIECFSFFMFVYVLRERESGSVRTSRGRGREKIQNSEFMPAQQSPVGGARTCDLS